MIKDLPPPALRFYNYLSDKPRWGVGKELLNLGKKESVIEKAVYIELPNHRRHYLSFDLDYECAAHIWIDKGFPEPTITIINNENSHATLHYELTTPILLPIKGRDSYVSFKAIRFYNFAREGLRCAMDGDKGYAGFNTKNPLFKDEDLAKRKWKVYWADKTYDLHYLNEFGCLNRLDKEILEIDPESRHMTMFDSCRKQAYRMVKHFSTFDAFNGAIHQICNDFYSSHLAHIEKSHTFPQSEIKSIARSITKWTWEKKNDPNFSNFTKNRGAMKIPRNFHEKNSPEHLAEIKSCQQQGAFYTHKIRKDKTEDKIRKAMEKLVSSGIQVSMPKLSELTGLSINTLYRNKPLIDSLDVK